MKQLLLVDDHELIRQSLRTLLEADGDIAVQSEARDGLAAVELVEAQIAEGSSTLDLVVMDISMPNMDGIEATKRIHTIIPELPVLILTMHDEPSVVDRVIAAGASAFVTKDVASVLLLETVRRVLSGEIVFPISMAEEMRKAGQSSPPLLSEREIEVLQLIADGRSTEAVAKELFISVKTVKNHLASIYSKLDARDRTQAVLEGLRAGILRLH